MARVEALVLAAGLSTRMGGPNKLLLPYRDTTVLGAVVRALESAEMPITVVTGRDAQLIERIVQPHRCVYNDRYREGMGGSIAVGASHIQAADGILIALGDMPALDPEVVRRLVAAFEDAPDGAIVAPVYSRQPGRPGHPVLFSIRRRPELCRLTGDTGARSILEEHRDAVVLVPVVGELSDQDLPDETSE